MSVGDLLGEVMPESNRLFHVLLRMSWNVYGRAALALRSPKTTEIRCTAEGSQMIIKQRCYLPGLTGVYTLWHIGRSPR